MIYFQLLVPVFICRIGFIAFCSLFQNKNAAQDQYQQYYFSFTTDIYSLLMYYIFDLSIQVFLKSSALSRSKVMIQYYHSLLEIQFHLYSRYLFNTNTLIFLKIILEIVFINVHFCTQLQVAFIFFYETMGYN